MHGVTLDFLIFNIQLKELFSHIFYYFLSSRRTFGKNSIVYDGDTTRACLKKVSFSFALKLETFESMQKHYFEAVLKAAKGKISGSNGAAVLTGMHPNTLRSKLEKLGVTFKAVKPEL